MATIIDQQTHSLKSAGYEREIYKSFVTIYLKNVSCLGVQKGDMVAIYMPMILELVVAMFACARIGAVHSVVFGGYSSDSLAERILDGNCKIIVTAVKFTKS
ncbi:UNVERIFIED_CONTAM: Acetyl-coenzyme A synthetase [Trichonephila clavipes]